MSEISEAINEMRNMRESYDQLVEAQASLAADVQALKDAHVLTGYAMGDVTFIEGFTPHSVSEAIFAFTEDKIKALKNTSLISLDNSSIFSGKSNIEYLELDGVLSAGYITDIGGIGALVSFANCTNLKHLILKDSAGIYLCALNNTFAFSGCNNLEELIIPKVLRLYFGTNRDYSMPSSLRKIDASGLQRTFHWNANMSLGSCLIDFIFGKDLLGSTSVVNWDPSEAIDEDSESLLTPEDFAAGFTNNREKLLYNIREHIAANLSDRTGLSPYTLTFSQNLRNAFDQATEDAFAAKNWDIAPVRS